MAGAKQMIGACLAVVLFQVCSAATSHIVGDSSGWIIPSGGSTAFYSTWAAKETFIVGDFLVFNFVSGAHTVAEVTKSDFDSCSSTSPITLLNNGPANLTISSAGAHYYICTFPGHCGAGQKLSITATAAASASPPTSSPAPKSAAPTPKSTPSSPTAAPTPKSTTTPSASPAPKSSPAAPTPSAGSPTPVTAAPTPSSGAPASTPASAPAAAAPGPMSASPMAAPATSPVGAGPEMAPSPVAVGPLAPTPGAEGPTPGAETPTGTPGSDAAVTGAGLVLPVLVIIGASFLY